MRELDDALRIPTPPFQGRGRGWVSEASARCRRFASWAGESFGRAVARTHPYEQAAIPPEWLWMSGGHPHLLIPSLEREGRIRVRAA